MSGEDPLAQLLHDCTVRIACGGETGTGFFVAPGVILTCAHVVRGHPAPVTVTWRASTCDATVAERTPEPYPDIAVLHVPWQDHPCALLDRVYRSGDPAYAWGHAERTSGSSLTVTVEGSEARDDCTWIKLKDGQVIPGMSGAALLNRRTGAICGIISETRDRHLDLGGFALPIAALTDVQPALLADNRAFHTNDATWSTRVATVTPARLTVPPPALGKLPPLFGRDVKFQQADTALHAASSS